MKLTYNYGQEFTLKEIDMCDYYLIFTTNNNMEKFGENYEIVMKKNRQGYQCIEKVKKEDIEFKVSFEHIEQLSNIPKLLWEYLEENDLMYWND